MLFFFRTRLRLNIRSSSAWGGVIPQESGSRAAEFKENDGILDILGTTNSWPPPRTTRMYDATRSEVHETSMITVRQIGLVKMETEMTRKTMVAGANSVMIPWLSIITQLKTLGKRC